MKYKNLDIRTVDLFFEIFADPKKFTDNMAEMRKVRDEIKAEHGLVDTKDKADHFLRQAVEKMASVNDYERKAIAVLETDSVKLASDVEKYELVSKKDREWISVEKIKLSNDRGQFTRTSTALKANLETRLGDVSKREEKVKTAELSLAEKKKEHEAYVKRVKAAV